MASLSDSNRCKLAEAKRCQPNCVINARNCRNTVDKLQKTPVIVPTIVVRLLNLRFCSEHYRQMQLSLVIVPDVVDKCSLYYCPNIVDKMITINACCCCHGCLQSVYFARQNKISPTIAREITLVLSTCCISF